jgi:drug/metabolite transporter (DMT)-like permease
MINVKPSIYMILSAFFYSLQNLDVKILTKYYSIWIIIFFRGLISFIISILFILILQIKPILGVEKKKLLLRGFLGSFNLFLGLIALVYLNLSTTTIILSTSSVWFSIMASIYYKEYWHFINNFGIVFILSGIFLISFQYENKYNIIGIFLALSSSFINALANITIKDIKDESTLVIGLYSMFLCIIMSIPGVFIEHKFNFKIIHSIYIYHLLSTGVFSLIAQNFKNKSLQITNNLGIILLKNIDIVFSFIWDILIFQYQFKFKELIGIFLILLGCLIKKY